MTMISDGVDAAPAGWGITYPRHSGASGKTPGHYDPGAARQLGGLMKAEPKCEPGAKIAAKAWARVLRSSPVSDDRDRYTA